METKKFSKAKLLILLPIAVIIVSGCTSVSSGSGVVIVDWAPELTQVYSNENVDFLLKVQNTGTARARNVRAEIGNIDTSEWGGGFYSSEKNLGDLIPADLEANTPGEVKTTQFQNLRAPEIPDGMQFTYNPSIRVYYEYVTTAQKPITIVDKEELIRIQQQGKTLPSSATTYTAGPLSVEITMGDYVKTSSSYSFGQEYDVFPVHIRIVNTQWGSGGTVVPKTYSGFYGGWGEEDYPIRVKIDPPSGTNFVHSGWFGDYDCSSSQFDVELWKGDQAEITCELEVTDPPQTGSKKQSLITVELDYGYFTEAATTITVIGTKETSSWF